MATLKALNLEERLEEASRAPVCVLVGADDALVSRSLRLLKQSAAPADLAGSTVRHFEDLPEARDVFDELRTVPFLGRDGRRVVVLERGDEFLAEHWERLARYMRSPSSTGTLIMCLDKLDPRRPPGKRKKDAAGQQERLKAWRDLVKSLGSRGVVIDCRTPTWDEARRWVRSHAAQMGKKLTPRAVATLVEAVGPNLLALEGELDKLSAYIEPETTVTERDVGEMVAGARWRTVFDLGYAVSRGDTAEALRLCGQLLLRGEKREGIISVLARQVRQLWQVKRLHATGLSGKDIARQLRLPDFVVRRSLEVLGGLSEELFVRQLGILCAADVESKTTSLRSHEERVWMDSLLARLCRR